MTYDGPKDLTSLLAAARTGQIDLLPLSLRPLLAACFDPSLPYEIRSENTWLAASLIQLKIRQLLPAPPCPIPEPDEPPPAPPLRFDRAHLGPAAEFLSQRLGSASLTREPEPEPDPVPAPGLSLLDILHLARQALDAARAHEQIEQASPASVRIEDMIRVLEDALEHAGAADVALDALLDAQPDPARRLSLFLAVLELARLARVRIDQPDVFAPIALQRTSPIPD